MQNVPALWHGLQIAGRQSCKFPAVGSGGPTVYMYIGSFSLFAMERAKEKWLTM